MNSAKSFKSEYGITLKAKAKELEISYNTLKNRWYRGVREPALFETNNCKGGVSDHPLYRLWIDIKHRCNNENFPQYHDYGGRGIYLHDAWKDSRVFVAEVMKEIGIKPDLNLTLDRIDNDRGYEPGNIRWATRSEQALNRRPFKNSSSGHQSVSYVKNKGTWVVRFQRNHQNKSYYFRTLEQALEFRNLFLEGEIT